MIRLHCLQLHRRSVWQKYFHPSVVLIQKPNADACGVAYRRSRCCSTVMLDRCSRPWSVIWSQHLQYMRVPYQHPAIPIIPRATMPASLLT